MKMIEKLRNETRELHEQVEKENLACFIQDHSIDLETYKILLLQNYFAYKKTEESIAQFIPEHQFLKHKSLEKDLQYLDVDPEMHAENVFFECSGKAEALGAAYVVEGSALGGMVLARNLKKCKKLDQIEKHHFFSGNKDSLQNWKKFKNLLENYTFSEVEEEQAVQKAKETFQFFQKIFRVQFTPV